MNKEFLDTLEKSGFNVITAKDKNEALALSKGFIKSGMTIGLGGSVSVTQIGLLDFVLSQKDLIVHNQYEAGITMEENIQRRREGLVSDLFISSTNAITKDGKLVNADGSGNRVAALSYGPKKVLLIVGKNKIVDSVEDGFKRIMEVAAIKNIDRMNQKAIEMGKQPRHNIDNIANKFSWIKGDDKDRITIILVDEELGY